MKSALSIFFALMMLTTQIGVRFATHYCGEKAFNNSISLLGNDLPTCNMQEADEVSCTNQASIQHKPCCENQVTTLQIKDQYNASTYSVLNNSLIFLASFTSTYIFLIRPTDSPTINTSNYDPPVLELDIPVLIQSFLI